MASDDSGDYEILPMQELEDLRREVSALKRKNLTEGDKARLLIESIDRLAISVNRLITILDDAQKDIIDEYQQAKPVETLHQIAEQNEMIAKALISISDGMNGGKSVVFPSQYQDSSSSQSSAPRSILPSNFSGQQNQNQGMNNSGMNQGMNTPGINQGMNMQMGNQMGSQNSMGNMPMPPMHGYSQRMSMGMQTPSGISMPPMDDMPAMDNMPPLNPSPSADKKKFLGIL